MTLYKYLLIFLFSLLSFSSFLHAQVTLTSGGGIDDDTTQVYDIDQINVQLHKTEDLILKLNSDINGLTYHRIDTLFSRQKRILEREAGDFNSYNPQSLSKFFLNNIYLVWANYRVQIQKWQKEVDVDLNVVLNGMQRVDKLKRKWNANLTMLQERDLPSLAQRVYQVLHDLDALQEKLREHERKIVLLETRITDKLFLCDQIITETTQLQESLRNKTLSKTGVVIWNINLKEAYDGPLFGRVKKAWYNNFSSARYYFSSIGYSIVFFFIWAAFIVFGVLLLRKFYLLIGNDARVPGHVNVERVLISHPYAIITATLLLLWTVQFPFIPLLLSDALLITIVLALSSILFHFTDINGKRIVHTIILLLFLNVFELVFWYLGDYVRLYLFFESGVALFLVFYFFINFRAKNINNDSIRLIRMARKVVPVLLVLYAISFIGNILGFINLSVLLNKVSIRTVAVTMIAYGYIRIFNSLAFAFLEILQKKFPAFASRYYDKIQSRTSKVISLFVFLLWLRAFLTILEVRQEFLDVLQNFLTTEVEIGSLAVSLANILSFIAILAITYYIAVFIKKIIEKEILQTMKLPRGFPAAISMILRIFFVSLGVIFAISAAGIDMSKFGMIAGALGVGIGFGLQNIVQNFISGLILIFERPIQVGDTVEVNNLLGQVKDIGVRASNVVTYDGAEVVVPNSNLISNDLINWTLSDSRKRVEIKVGTAYGSDPNKVLEILKNAAVQHPDVVNNPEPRALFEGFGDSSLDFRLLFWVNFELGLGTKSDVAIEIYNKFAEEGIEIPFPQVDLHVKDVPKGESGELKPEAKTKAPNPNMGNKPLVDEGSGEEN